MDIIQRFKDLGGKFYSKKSLDYSNRELVSLVEEINDALPEMTSWETMTTNERKKLARQLEKVTEISDVAPRMEGKLDDRARENAIEWVMRGAENSGRNSLSSLSRLRAHLSNTSEFPDAQSIMDRYNMY